MNNNEEYVFQQAVQELEIYRAELEAQNDELREQKHALDERNIENEILFMNAPFPYILIDKKSFNIIKCNNQANSCFEIYNRNIKRVTSLIVNSELTIFLNWIDDIYQFSPLSIKLNNHNPEIFKLSATKYGENSDLIMISFQSLQKEYDYFEDLHKKEKIIQQKTKMAALGELLNNISHQWKQPLSVITALSTGLSLKNQMEKNLSKEIIEEYLNKITVSSNFLSETINEFRKFTSEDKEYSDFKTLDCINKILFMYTQLLQKEKITVDLQMDENQVLFGSPNQFIQVFMNFFSNSFDQFNLINNQDEDFVRLITIKSYFKDGKKILEFCDNAGGIKDDIIDSIFNPYFSTKKASVDRGIGLFMSQEIIENQLNGTITVKNDLIDSFDNKTIGAKFTITI